VAGRFALLGVLTGLIGWGIWLFRASRRELMRLAHFDTLTGLPNRRLFFDRLQAALARARRNKTRVALFYVDVADLNAVNDTFGHQAGDALLVQFAGRLRKNLRGADGHHSGRLGRFELWSDGMPVVSRLGGDEFTIHCEDVRSDDGVTGIAERILAAVKDPFEIGSNRIEVRLNVGVAVFPDDADESDGGERLLMCADSAMNECKQHRASDFVVYNEKTRSRVERQHALAVQLKTAFGKRQFELFYQPKASLVDGRIVSVEGLLRWRHPELGTVSPGEFIPILERSGGILEVGAWVVEQGCRDLIQLADSGFPSVKVSLNVSIRQLRHGDFHETVARLLDRFGIEPDRMILEITESMVMDDLERGKEALEKLRALGVGIAIDDFGTGYSSLTYLQHLPINCLKLDKGLIDGMVDARSTHVVESVIRLAQGLSLKTVAEGIEHEVQRDHLAALGCDQVQGFLLSEPMPLPEIIDWLSRRQRLA
jgi:predicted signal transduction protein with EAL and GGDEF domain